MHDQVYSPAESCRVKTLLEAVDATSAIAAASKAINCIQSLLDDDGESFKQQYRSCGVVAEFTDVVDAAAGDVLIVEFQLEDSADGVSYADVDFAKAFQYLDYPQIDNANSKILLTATVEDGKETAPILTAWANIPLSSFRQHIRAKAGTIAVSLLDSAGGASSITAADVKIIGLLGGLAQSKPVYYTCE